MFENHWSRLPVQGGWPLPSGQSIATPTMYSVQLMKWMLHLAILEKKEENVASKQSGWNGFSDDSPNTGFSLVTMLCRKSATVYMCVYYDVLNVYNIPISHCDIVELCRVISTLVWCILWGSWLLIQHWTK